MVYSNKNSVTKLKNTFLMVGILLLLTATAFIFLEEFVIVAIIAGFFLLGILLVTMLNLQYVKIAEENGRLSIRYYTVFSVNRQYESIEFPVSSLKKVEVSKYFLGLKWDVSFTVRLKQGFADYPPVCFSAIPRKERIRLINWIKGLK